jgi:hypothetical protein
MRRTHDALGPPNNMADTTVPRTLPIGEPKHETQLRSDDASVPFLHRLVDQGSDRGTAKETRLQQRYGLQSALLAAAGSRPNASFDASGVVIMGESDSWRSIPSYANPMAITAALMGES